MQVIIDEIVNNVRAVEKNASLSPDVLQQIINACVSACRDMMAKEARMREEQSIDGPWSLQPHGDR